MHENMQFSAMQLWFRPILFGTGDDVKEKKPDPLIYMTAAKRLGVSEKDCLLVEDSVIGLQAATKAGMSCVITYTSSTGDQARSTSDTC
ncbi:hypothetical protein REPUB_Repub10bG0106500 [Reevesia pubescens]